MRSFLLLVLGSLAIATTQAAADFVPPKTDAEMIRNALSAAPEAVAETAA